MPKLLLIKDTRLAFKGLKNHYFYWYVFAGPGSKRKNVFSYFDELKVHIVLAFFYIKGLLMSWTFTNKMLAQCKKVFTIPATTYLSIAVEFIISGQLCKSQQKQLLYQLLWLWAIIFLSNAPSKCIYLPCVCSCADYWVSTKSGFYSSPSCSVYLLWVLMFYK